MGLNPIHAKRHAKSKVIHMSLVDVEALAGNWRKASSSVNNGACVEVGSAVARVLVRDSVSPSGAVIAYAPAAWQVFIGSTKAGAFDSLR